MDPKMIEQIFGITLENFEKLCSNSNTDYSGVPTPILVQPEIINKLFDEMSLHNIEYNEDYGFSTSSFFALKQIKKKKKKDIKYEEKFQLEGDADGKEYLKKLFRMIADSNPNNKNTIMKIIESIQDKYGMKPSTIDDPKLFPLFLPTHSSVGNLNKLMKTIKRFVNENKLWSNYHLCYSNSENRSDENNCDYTTWIDKQLEISRRDKKHGCILLLGDQGKLGHTYHKCDASIHLDNGVNIDAVKQAYYRSLTEREGKTIGINVDLNIQRVYNYMYKRVQDYKRNTGKDGTTGEILQTLYQDKLFIFNPQEFNFGDYEVSMIEYFKKFSDRMKEEISIDAICDRIKCDDNLNEIINKIELNNSGYTINEDLNGNQLDVKKPGKEKKKADPVSNSNSGDNSDEVKEADESKEENEGTTFIDINKTKILYESLTKLCGLLLKSSWINPDIRKEKSKLDLLKELKDDEYLFSIIKSKISKDFDIDEINLNIIYDKYIETMMNNMDVLDDIFEIYSTTSSDKLRKIIEKHFIPTQEQRKKNAEIPTPTECCDEMIDKMPEEYFRDIHKTFEPCCGKANFVLAIFDRFYNGLSHIEDKLLRCQTIIEKCIYYSDIDPVNIFITRHLLMCHAISKFPENEQWNIYQKINSFNYNDNIGNTLEININDKWNIDNFDAIIGNPPYQAVDPETGISKGGGNNLYTKFIYLADKMLLKDGYLLYINPPTYFSPGRSNNKNNMNLRKDILDNYYYHHINLQECSKHFPGVGSKFIYYLIQKKKETNRNMKVVCKYNDNIYESFMEQKLIIRDYLPYLLTPDCLTILDKLKKETDKLKIFNSPDNRGDKKHVLNKKNKEYADEYKVRAIREGYTYPIQATGVQVFYSLKPCKNQYDKKVLMSESGYLRPVYDNGVMGVGGHCFACIVKDKEEGDKVIQLLNSKLYKFYIETNKWSGFHNRIVLQDLPDIIGKIDIINDININDYFSLSDSEIHLIENTI